MTIIDTHGPANERNASWGNHRLIHPFSHAPNGPSARDAVVALNAWKTLLDEIVCDGFAPVGVITQCAPNFIASARQVTPVSECAGPDFVARYPLWQGHTGTIAFAKDFGVLMAADILTALHATLLQSGQAVFVTEEVHRLSPESPSVQTHHQRHVAKRGVILAAGFGARTVLSHSEGALQAMAQAFQRFECHVMHADHPLTHSANADQSAFFAMGGEDLWGMQPVRGQRLKLGFGLLTQEHDGDTPTDPRHVSKCILAAYTARWPAFADCLNIAVESRHWAGIALPFPFVRVGPHVIVTADNGGGFKFAPLTANAVANAMIG